MSTQERGTGNVQEGGERIAQGNSCASGLEISHAPRSRRAQAPGGRSLRKKEQEPICDVFECIERRFILSESWGEINDELIENKAMKTQVQEKQTVK